MYIYNEFKVPELKDENRDILRYVRKTKIKYIIFTLALALFCGLVYYIYFFKRDNDFVWYQHILFWGIFFCIPYLWAGWHKPFSDKSYTALISDVYSKEFYWFDYFQKKGGAHAPRTKMFTVCKIKKTDGKNSSYRVPEAHSHNLVLKNNMHIVKFAGLKYAVAVNEKLPKYFICAKCGYLCGVDEVNCQRCSSSIIKIFTEDAHLQACDEIQTIIQDKNDNY